MIRKASVRVADTFGVYVRTIVQLLLLTIVLVNGQPAPIRINSGSSTSATLTVNGETQVWAADDGKYTYGPTGTWSITCPRAINGTLVPELYCTERLFFGNNNPPTGYKIPVPQPGRYIVRLLFAETFYPLTNYRVFNVLLQGALVETDLDLYVEKGFNTAYVITRFVTVVPSSSLFIDIGFQSLKDNAKINGVEIRYSSSIVPTPVAPAPSAPVEPTSKLGTLATVPLFINAGSTQPFTAPGQIVWLPDQYYSGVSSTYSSCPATINNSQLDLVYCTERFAVGLGNLSYTIPIKNGKFGVSLHFEELVFTEPGKRVFDVAIQGKIVLSNFDIVAAVGFKKSLVKTFQFTITNLEPVQIDFIHKAENAKISGIEIGSWVDPYPVPTPVAPPTAAPIPRVKAPIRINAGSTAAWTDPISNAVWSADTYYVGGWTFGSNLCNNNIIGTELDTLACSERFFTSPGGKYFIPIQPGLYVLKLLFVETLFTTPAAREFKVFVNGQVVNKKLDIIDDVGPNSAYILSRSVTVDASDPGITIEFQTFIQNAKINAIEIVDYNSRPGSSLEAGQTLRTKYGTLSTP